MYDADVNSVRSGNYHTLVLTTPVAQGKEPGDYDKLRNKPKINSVELVGDLSFEDIGFPDISDVPTQPLSNSEIDIIVGE